MQFFNEGQARWHALIVAAQREEAAERMLQRAGVYAFHPVTKRTTMRRHKRHVTVSRYLPGYVFARFPGPAIWHQVFATPIIVNAVRHSSGWPAVLNPEDLERIHAMRAMDEAEEERQRQARVIRRGDKVRIMSGAFEGEEVEVLDVGNSIKVRMCILGSELPVTVEFAGVEKIGVLQHNSPSDMFFAKAAE